MPEKTTNEPRAARSFAELLEELPPHAETVNLAGVVSRSRKPGHFRLTPQGGGRPVELPVDAVRGHTVLHREHGHLLVQLEAELAQVEALLEGYEELFLGGGIRTYLTSPYSWARDPLHVPRVQAEERQEANFKSPFFDKAVHTDPVGHYPWQTDPILHKVIKDPGADLRYEQNPYHVPPGDPYRQAAGGLAPFVLATPHHAPPGSLAMQTAGLQAQVLHGHKVILADPNLKAVINEGTKHSILDHKVTAKDLISDGTLKEVVKDVINDTFKESFADPGGTLAESVGGTLAEGVGGVNPGVINQF